MTTELTYPYLLNEDFIQACRDYFYLVDHHFPERGVLKLVGDRYKLNGDQRTVLYRGISSQKRSAIRNVLLVSDIAGKNLLIDGYNVLFTLLNYRLGRITFISTDQILRDAGSLHGKLSDENTFAECIELLMRNMVKKHPGKADIYLDSPVSHSERHAALIRNKMHEYNLTGDCHVIKSADWALTHSNEGIIATSDTAIIERAHLPVIDLPREILEDVYNASFLKLTGLLSPDKI